MKVTLFDYTGNGTANPARFAASKLIFTKSTRLKMSPALLGEIADWNGDRIAEELQYMANTVPSSWEFCHYSFSIEGVSRAFTHQLVRTRTASYAQQALRVVDVSEGFAYRTGPTVEAEPRRQKAYAKGMSDILDAYAKLLEEGSAVEDARDILPIGVLTNICMDANLRVIVDLARKRVSKRVQDEYRAVLEGMKAEVMRVHPWAAFFLSRTFDKAAAELDDMLEHMPISHRNDARKLLDLMRQTSAIEASEE